MAPCVEESDVKATPETIWKTCFADIEFEKWAPDVERMANASGKCENGTTVDFIMKTGPKVVPAKLLDVEENKSLRFYGTAAYGLLTFDGFIEITPKDEETSHIKYTFSLGGILGAIVMTLKPAPAVDGTKHGLENMVKISEEAQKAN